MSDEIHSLITIEARQKGVKEAADATVALAEANKQAYEASELSKKASVGIEGSYKALKRSIDDTYATATRMVRGVDTLQKAFNTNKISADELRQGMEQLTSKLAAAKDWGAGGLERFAAQMTALGKSDVAAVITKQIAAQQELTRVQEAYTRQSEEVTRYLQQMEAASARLRAEINPLGAAQETYNRAVEEATRLQREGYLTLSEMGAAQDLALSKYKAAADQITGAAAAQQRAQQAAAEAMQHALRENDQLTASAARLRAEINPLGAAQDNLNAELAEYATLASRGKISTAELAQAQALAQDRFVQASNAITGMGKASGLASHEIKNLTYQIFDVGQTLALGMPPMMVLMQQGPQIAQIFGPGSGGVTGVMKGLGQAFGSMISPMTLAIGGIAALGVTAAASYNSYLNMYEALERSTKGIGAMSGNTADQLMAVADAAAKMGNVTTREAQRMAAAFNATGRASRDHMQQVIDITSRYAQTVGVDAATATETMARAMQDPIRGMEDLNAQLGFLDAKTQEHVRTLVNQGNKQAAFNALMQAMPPYIDQATSATTALGQAWYGVATFAANAYAAIGQAISYMVDGMPAAVELAKVQANIRGIREEQEKLISKYGDGQWQVVAFEGGLTKRLEDAERQYTKLQFALDRAASTASLKRLDQGLNQISTSALSIVSNLDPIQTKLDKLKNDNETLEKAISDPFRNSADQISRYKDALAANEAAIKSMYNANGQLLTQTDIQIKRDQLALEAKKAKTNAEKADIAQRQKELDLIGDLIPAHQRQQIIELAGANAMDYSTKKTKEKISATQKLENAVDQVIHRNQEQIDLMKLEIQGYGKTAEEVMYLKLRHDAETAAIRNKTTVTTKQDEALRNSSREYAKYAQQLDATRKAIEAVNEVQDLVSATWVRALEDMILNAESLTDAIKGIGEAWSKASLDALLAKHHPITDALGRKQEVRIIHEPDVYRLIFGSKLESAQEFEDWVVSEVLPSIRKTGGYSVQPQQEQAPQFPIPQTFAEALMLAANQAAQIEHQKGAIAEMKPKAEFHDDVASAVNAQDFMAVAKAFGTGRTRFANWLRARKFIMENRHPYQPYVDAGYFRVIEKKRKDKDTGEKFTYTQTLITGKGFTYLQKKWVEDHKGEPA